MEAHKLDQKHFIKKCRVAYGLKKTKKTNKGDVELTLSQKINNRLKTHKYMTAIPTQCASFITALNHCTLCRDCSHIFVSSQTVTE